MIDKGRWVKSGGALESVGSGGAVSAIQRLIAGFFH
jgi:hypothetical protein